MSLLFLSLCCRLDQYLVITMAVPQGSVLSRPRSLMSQNFQDSMLPRMNVLSNQNFGGLVSRTNSLTSENPQEPLLSRTNVLPELNSDTSSLPRTNLLTDKDSPELSEMHRENGQILTSPTRNLFAVVHPGPLEGLEKHTPTAGSDTPSVDRRVRLSPPILVPPGLFSNRVDKNMDEEYPEVTEASVGKIGKQDFRRYIVNACLCFFVVIMDSSQF